MHGNCCSELYSEVVDALLVTTQRPVDLQPRPFRSWQQPTVHFIQAINPSKSGEDNHER
jgi:hypothetical protein